MNKALSLVKPVPFDFLSKGEIIRGSLTEWCSEHGVGEEETLEIEYIESVMPPQKMAEIPHEDWVSSVSCQLPRYFLTASYDGHLRAFDLSKNLTASIPAHPAPITSFCLVSSSTLADDSQQLIIASASHDLTSRLAQVTLNPIASTNESKALASLHLHTAPVSSISANAAGTHVLTASWDGLIGYWDTTVPSTDEVPEPALNERDRSKKRRRVEEGEGRGKRKAPLSVFKSHTAKVSKVLFASGAGETAYSCSFDSTVRRWDTETGVCSHTITASEKPFLDMALTPDGNSALATSTDRSMTLYDLRSSTTTLVSASNTYMHPSTPSCVATSATNSHQVVTGAYDGVVRVWDLRSPKSAMATFKPWNGSGNKVLSVDWKRGIVGVGGERGLEMWKVGEEQKV